MYRQPCDLHKTYNSGCPACKLKFAGVTVPAAAAEVAKVLEVPVEIVDDPEGDIFPRPTLTPMSNAEPVEDIPMPEPVGDIPLPDAATAQESVRVDDFDDDELV